MFKTRLISGIILIALALATILPGGLPLLLMVGFRVLRSHECDPAE